jgi:hypothetical protein
LRIQRQSATWRTSFWGLKKPCNCAKKAKLGNLGTVARLFQPRPKPRCDSAFLCEAMRTSRCSVARFWITKTAYVVVTTTSKHGKSAAAAFDM